MIIFQNPGTLDLRAIRTFGLTSKDGETTIGRFGTGLKYATAVIARNGGQMAIHADGAWHEVGVREEDFRGKTVSQMTLDGQDLPFTTDLGRDWELWQAFRELYANALDEEGGVRRSDIRDDPGADQCAIAVTLDAFEAIYFTMEEHFIGDDEAPIWESDYIQVFKGRSPFVFYRGIAIQKLKNPAQFRYNLKGYVDLTEDRTAKYSWQVQARLAKALMACDMPEIVDEVVDQRNAFEASLDFSDSLTNGTPSEVFLGATVKSGVNANPTASAVVRAQLPPDGSTATVIQKGTPGAKELTHALRVLRALGADLGKAKFVLAEGIPIIGDSDVRGDAVFISEDIFDHQERMTLAVVQGFGAIQGNAWLARTLIKTADLEDEDA